MVEYERKLGRGPTVATIRGSECDRCRYTSLDNDEDVWGAVGL